jgi:putative ABC transport system permease protein
MLNSYFKIAYRSLFKNKTFSLINILGLGISLAACILIFEYISFEFSYDKFHTNSDRIYRVINDRFQHGRQIQHSTLSYPGISPAMTKDYPEIEDYTRILVPGGETLIKTKNRIFLGDKSLFVDNSFLKVFDFHLLIGERESGLAEKRSVILTERIAKKYFQADDLSKIIGKELYWGSEPQPYAIKGICQNIPDNSHLQFDILLSYSSLGRDYNEPGEGWPKSNVRHYLLLKKDADYRTLQSKFEDFSDRNFQGDKVTGSREEFLLQPLNDIHLYSNFEFEYAETINGKAVWIMLLVSIIILAIACINYINLTIARSIERAKEVGVRKTMGAARVQLVKQFVLESIVLSVLALIVSFIVVHIFQTSFNEILNVELSIWSIFVLGDSMTAIIIALILLAGLFLSGFYPAFILSTYKPVTVLKGKFLHSSQGQFARRSLVVFQFMISCALMTLTLIVSKQLDYIDKVDLGLNIHNTVIVSPPMRTSLDSAYIDRVRTFKHSLQQLSKVTHVATSSHVPGTNPFRTFGIRLQGESSSTQHTMNQLVVDEGFFDMYNVRLLAGRMFEISDCNFDWNLVDKIIINRKTLQALDQDIDDAIGKKITIGDKPWTIIGVVENFHQQSLHNSIEPILFTPDYNTFNPISIKLRSEDYQPVLGQIKSLFEKSFPDNAFNYSILEDSYKNQYQDDTQFSEVVNIFTALAVIISCMGLIGLSSYTAVQRTKEIGIRKVLGASITSIISLLGVDFIKLVLFAAFLSIPLAYFASNSWLMNYAYRIIPDVFLFALPVITILIIAAVTISVQIFKTAKTNPVDTLKYE